MKKLFAALLAASFALPVLAATPFNVSCSTGSTTCTAVSSTSSSMQVLGMIISVSSADNITIQCGSNTMIGPLYFGASSGLTQSFLFGRGNSGLICPANQNLNVIKGTATTPLTVYSVVDQ